MNDAASLFPRASRSFAEANPAIFATKLEPASRSALERPVERSREGAPRVIVRVTGLRVRPLDADNFAGGCKNLLDSIRHAGLVHGDEPWNIDFQTRQEKVAHYKDQKTIIEIIYP